MPLVTLTTTNANSELFLTRMLDEIHAALVTAGVPTADKFHRVLRLDSTSLRLDPTYPDLKAPRSERAILIEITLSVGRTLKIKRQIAESIAGSAEKLGLSGEDVMIVFNETRWENWSFGGGRFYYT
jgi:phenylpyruvate tautomerase PptA (4-oxalocrotonate tautomerase family)